MRSLPFALLLSTNGLVLAADLAHANADLAAKDYSKAFAL
jgi:hypothetical protein